MTYGQFFCYNFFMKLVDAHAHLTDRDFENDLQKVIASANESGVTKVISAGYDFLSSQKALELAENQDGIFATAGVHPENLANFEEVFSLEDEKQGKNQKSELFDALFFEKARLNLEKEFEKIENLAQNAKIVAIGEIGLDYHFLDFLGREKLEKFGQILTEAEKEELKNLQKWAFLKQIEISGRLKKPIVVHSRDAMGDTLEILKNHRLGRESLLHCYSGSLESAQELMKLGFSFSFGGVVTFKNAKNVQEVVKNLPIERILLETDSPYMSPEPFRGKRNEPKNVVYVADQIARLKGMKIDEVARITTENAERLFRI